MHAFPFISDSDSDFFQPVSTLTFSHEQEDDEDTQRRMANVKQSRAEQRWKPQAKKILLALSSNVAEVSVCVCGCVWFAHRECHSATAVDLVTPLLPNATWRMRNVTLRLCHKCISVEQRRVSKVFDSQYPTLYAFFIAP